MGKTIKTDYDLDYGLLTMKTTGLNISKTNTDKLFNKIKKTIDTFLKEIN